MKPFSIRSFVEQLREYGTHPFNANPTPFSSQCQCTEPMIRYLPRNHTHPERHSFERYFTGLVTPPSSLNLFLVTRDMIAQHLQVKHNILVHRLIIWFCGCETGKKLPQTHHESYEISLLIFTKEELPTADYDFSNNQFKAFFFASRLPGMFDLFNKDCAKHRETSTKCSAEKPENIARVSRQFRGHVDATKEDASGRSRDRSFNQALLVNSHHNVLPPAHLGCNEKRPEGFHG